MKLEDIGVEDYIDGNKFVNMCELIYAQWTDGDYPLKNTFTKENVLSMNKDKIIVYTHPHWASSVTAHPNFPGIPSFFEVVDSLNLPDIKFILVSHNGDVPIDKEKVDLKPKNVIKWFSCNVDVEHPDVIQLPCGVEHKGWHWSNRPDKMPYINKLFKTGKNYEILCYMDFALSNEEKFIVYNMLKDKDFVATSNYFKSAKQDFYTFANAVHKSKFVLCPRSLSIDTQRICETLYMGSIPVVKKSRSSIFYEGLPICFIDDWSQITEQFLLDEFDRISNIEYNYEKISFFYYKNLIKSV